MAGTVARVTEISARSDTSFEDAVKVGLNRASATLRGVTSAWIKGAVGRRRERRDYWLPRQLAGHLRPRITLLLIPARAARPGMRPARLRPLRFRPIGNRSAHQRMAPAAQQRCHPSRRQQLAG